VITTHKTNSIRSGSGHLIKHYRIKNDTGERVLNTDFNHLLALNAIAYIVFLVLLFTVGAFGGVASTTYLLASKYQSVLTTEKIFFNIAWGALVPWLALWVVWQIAIPSERNCPGVSKASYFFPFFTLLYAGYTISLRYDGLVLGTIFAYGITGTMVALSMSLQMYRDKMLPGYLVWQAPHTLLTGWMIIETMLVTNAVFVKISETWIVMIVISAISLLVIFITAIAWLSSYPVDFMIPIVIACAVGGMYLKLEGEDHYYTLITDGWSVEWLNGAQYTVLAVFILICISIFLKVLIVLTCQRPKDQAERQRKEDSRVSLNIVIDTGAANNNNDDDRRRKSKKKSRSNRDSNRDSKRDSNRDRDRDDREDSRRSKYDDERPRSPKKKKKKARPEREEYDDYE